MKRRLFQGVYIPLSRSLICSGTLNYATVEQEFIMSRIVVLEHSRNSARSVVLQSFSCIAARIFGRSHSLNCVANVEVSVAQNNTNFAISFARHFRNSGISSAFLHSFTILSISILASCSVHFEARLELWLDWQQ